MKDWMQERDAVLTMVMLIITALLAVMPNPFDSPYAQDVTRVKAEVVEVDNTDIQQFGLVKTGSQALQVKVLEGDYKGRVFPAGNTLLGKMETDKIFQKGDTAFVVLEFKGNDFFSATAYDHYRLDIALLLVGLFALLLIGYAGWRGVRALVSFAFALLMIWKVLLPNILLYRDPVWIALGVVVVITGATLTLVAGANRTALVALVGSILGLLLTSGLARILLPAFHLHGAIQPFSETLLYTGFDELNLTRVFIAAIFIGASGAVLDVAIDVATAMQEVLDKRPDLSIRDLIRSGLVVGRNMTSTMVTTLLMAYASGYMALLMVFMAQGIPPVNALNTNYVAAEVVRTVIGSFGLVTVAPLTALIGGFIFKWGHQMTQEPLQPVRFRVKAAHFELGIGDEVTPDTWLGEDAETGMDIRAGLAGVITAMDLEANREMLVVSVAPAR